MRRWKRRSDRRSAPRTPDGTRSDVRRWKRRSDRRSAPRTPDGTRGIALSPALNRLPSRPADRLTVLSGAQVVEADDIGAMVQVRAACGALRWAGERATLCCSGGKVRLVWLVWLVRLVRFGSFGSVGSGSVGLVWLVWLVWLVVLREVSVFYSCKL